MERIFVTILRTSSILTCNAFFSFFFFLRLKVCKEAWFLAGLPSPTRLATCENAQEWKRNRLPRPVKKSAKRSINWSQVVSRKINAEWGRKWAVGDGGRGTIGEERGL